MIRDTGERVAEQLRLEVVDTFDGHRLVDVDASVIRRVPLTCGCVRVEAERPGGGQVHVTQGEHCQPEAKVLRCARLRLLRLATPQHPPGTVAKNDQRVSLNDARAALSMAGGADPNAVDPVTGTWAGVA